MGLDPAKHLGKDLASLNSYLHKLKEYVDCLLPFCTLSIDSVIGCLSLSLAGCMG